MKKIFLPGCVMGIAFGVMLTANAAKEEASPLISLYTTSSTPGLNSVIGSEGSRIIANKKRAFDIVDLVKNNSRLSDKFTIGKQHITDSRGLTVLIPVKHLAHILPDGKSQELREKEISLLIKSYRDKIEGEKEQGQLERLMKIAGCNNAALELYRELEGYDGKVVLGCEGFPYGDYDAYTSGCVRDNQGMLMRMRLKDADLKKAGKKPAKTYRKFRKEFLVFLNLIMATTNYEITNGPLQSFGIEDPEAFRESIEKREKYGFKLASYWVYDQRNRGIADSIKKAFRDYKADVVVCPIGQNHLNDTFTISLKEYFERSRYNQSYIVLEPKVLSDERG